MDNREILEEKIKAQRQVVVELCNEMAADIAKLPAEIQEQVKENFDPQRILRLSLEGVKQGVEKHPLPAVAAATLAGFFCARILSPNSGRLSNSERRRTSLQGALVKLLLAKAAFRGAKSLAPEYSETLSGYEKGISQSILLKAASQLVFPG